MSKKNDISIAGPFKGLSENVVDNVLLYINGVSLYISLDDLKNMVNSGITESIDPYKPLSLMPSQDNGLIPNKEEVALSLNPRGVFKCVLTRDEAADLLKQATQKMEKELV